MAYKEKQHKIFGLAKAIETEKDQAIEKYIY
jgi:hypothetical protein